MRYHDKVLPVLVTTDTVVVGGGTAGVAAAYAAAVYNRVLVIEKNTLLTGTQANALVTPMMPSHAKRLSFNRELLHRLDRYVGTPTGPVGDGTARWFNPEAIARVTEMMLQERGVEILYDARVIDAVVADGVITALIVQAFNQTFAVTAQNYVDASGDAWLARLVGIPTVSGDDGKHSALSLRMEVGGVDIPTLKAWCGSQHYVFSDLAGDDRYFEFVSVPEEARTGEVWRVFQAGVAAGELTVDDVRYIQGFTMPGKPGVMAFNNPQLPNRFAPDDPLQMAAAVAFAHGMQDRLVDFLRRRIPGFGHAFLAKRATMLGIRESYRIQGVYVMRDDDYGSQAKFADGIARGDWFVDIHTDVEDKTRPAYRPLYPNHEYYEVPYRSLVTREIANYIAVGRHISASFVMQSSIRIQTTAEDMGEAAGLACCEALAQGVALNRLDGAALKKKLASRWAHYEPTD
ncbi:FAD-dependent oxidoreductase [Lacticaseibacillus suihuaensis]